MGEPSLVSGDAAVSLSPGATTLAAYLALAPAEGRSRATAAAQLFADCPQSAARRRLNTAVWRLKSEVRESTGLDLVVARDSRMLALNQKVGVAVDAARFADLVTSVRSRPDLLDPEEVSRLECAVSLHRGLLLEPCQDDWVLADRVRIENLYLNALDSLAQHHGTVGNADAVIHYGELALDVEPLREDIHRHLMSAYSAAGRTDLVERQFERCRMTLLENLGADPMPETLAIYNRLRRGGGSTPSLSVGALIAELERTRREVARVADSVDRALDRVRQLS